VDRLETARLRGVPLQPGDFADLDAMHRDERVMATLGGVRTASETRDWLARNLDHWQRWGYGIWMWRDPEGRFAGRAGIRHLAVDGSHSDEVELAWALMPEFWGRGLATEIARTLLRVGFDQLCLPSLVAFTLVDNRPSRRVMEKLGMAFEKSLLVAGLPHVLYRICNNEAASR
jgi:[ribosomal protein S5]-alanine N-acetyltransferase